jgi:superoxide reductase
MAQLKQIYKCNVCGNIVEVLHTGAGDLVCCGQPMILQTENTVDAALEKHVPVIEKTDTGIIVKVGSVPHPMEESHFIEWIELIADGVSYRKMLKAGDEPKAKFCLSADNVTAREYCNLHGLWRT